MLISDRHAYSERTSRNCERADRVQSRCKTRRRTPTSGREIGGPLRGFSGSARRHLGDLDLDAGARSRPAASRGRYRRSRPCRSRRRPNFSRRRVACDRRAAEQADLELVEHIERHPAALDRTLPPLGRVLEPLQGDQRVDAADGAQPDRRSGRAWSLARPSDEERRCAAPPDRGRGRERPSVRSVQRCACRGRRLARARGASRSPVTGRSVWLIGGKDRQEFAATPARVAAPRPAAIRAIRIISIYFSLYSDFPPLGTRFA